MEELLNSLNSLDNALLDVRAVWKDEVAQSYDSINNNIKQYALNFSKAYEDAEQGYKLIIDNYDGDEYDSQISQLSLQIEEI